MVKPPTVEQTLSRRISLHRIKLAFWVLFDFQQRRSGNVADVVAKRIR
jgi:hypothetical protein